MSGVIGGELLSPNLRRYADGRFKLNINGSQKNYSQSELKKILDIIPLMLSFLKRQKGKVADKKADAIRMGVSKAYLDRSSH